MRKVVVGAFVSMDGVMQAPGGPQEDPTGGFRFGGWVAPLADRDPVFGEEIGKLFGPPYDLLLGRRTYDIFAAHWPHAEGGPDDGIAKQFNRITKYVATRSDQPLGWQNSVRLHDAAKDVARLRKDDGPTLVTQGSTDLIETLLAHDLVDEIRMFTFPVLLGHGKKLFNDGACAHAYSLTHSRVSPSGLICATYARGGDVQTGSSAQDPPHPAEVARRERWRREGGSLRDTDAVATLGVKDVAVAARFYEETLGFRRIDAEGDEVVVFKSGDTAVNVYRSSYAGTNRATAVTWAVDDVEDVVRTLSDKGVRFEHYDLPQTTREGDVHVSGHIRVAWFTDPDGNILSVVNR